MDGTGIITKGDRIRISTELIKLFYQNPDHRSDMVQVVEIQTESDGSKTITVQNVE